MSFLDAVKSIGEERANEKEGAAKAVPAARARKAPTGNGDPEIQAMNAEAPLIDLIRADTGEVGRQGGDYVAFHRCPICGHSDCFRYYPETNSWSCFGDSNTTGYEGGSYVEYQRAAHGMTATDAVKALRDVTGHPYEGKATKAKEEAAPTGDAEEQGAPKLLLPSWEQVRAVDPPKRAPVLIDGILRRGHVGLIAGKGKSGKSWSGIELSVAVATGGKWFGHRCERGRVLFVDPELDKKSMHNRFGKVCRAMGIDPAEVDSSAVLWGLRGVVKANGEPPTVADLAHDIEARCSFGDFALVVIDSASCFIEGDENSSVDVRRFFAHVLRIAKATGAAVLIVHHYGKGDAGDRSSIDRARGSSVWGDSPDAPLSLTEIFPKEGKPSDYLADGERAFVLEDSGLREFPGMEPLHLIFGYPVHRIDAKGITAEWRPRTSTGRSRGGKQTAELNKAKKRAEQTEVVSALLGWFYSEGIGEEGASLKECAEHVGLDSRKVRAAVEDSSHLRIYKPSPRKSFVVPAHPPKAERDPSTLFE